ncbi:MAG: hypothetical protein H6625_00035 [Bdellovibrionaceae bacterium]|nr:hypothetical protein [Pseudobdellovibrionaceae bacterium]
MKLNSRNFKSICFLILQRKFNSIISVSCFIFFVGCALQPTKVYESQQVDVEGLIEASQKPLVLNDQSIVIDARNPFDYNLSHIPQAISIQWHEFSRPGKHRGYLSDDLFKEARRLALKGISPETPIIVLGNGPKGSGEEGRLAWTLLYLGFKNVQFSAMNHFKILPMTNKENAPRPNVPVWKPHFITSLLANVDEVKKVVSQPQSLKERVFLIDVRSEKEYFRRQADLDYEYPDINAIHIPWTQFINKQGRPDFKIIESLKDLGVLRHSRMIIISNQGLRSGAVTAALTSMGYTNVGNFTGGYQQLFPKE